MRLIARRKAVFATVGFSVLLLAATAFASAAPSPTEPAYLSREVPKVAFDGSNFLVVWGESLSSYDVYGSRVSTGGDVLDPGGIPIAASGDFEGYPVVSFGGGNSLAVFTQGQSGLRARRIAPDGTVLDQSPITVTTENTVASDIAFGAMEHVVVWAVGDGATDAIKVTRVTPDGQVLDPDGIVIATGSGNLLAPPRIAFDGMNFLIVWNEVRGAEDVYAARLTPSGDVLDPNGVAITHGVYPERYADVTFDGANYLVAWNRVRGRDRLGRRHRRTRQSQRCRARLDAVSDRRHDQRPVPSDLGCRRHEFARSLDGQLEHRPVRHPCRPGRNRARSRWLRDLHSTGEPAESGARFRRGTVSRGLAGRSPVGPATASTPASSGAASAPAAAGSATLRRRHRLRLRPRRTATRSSALASRLMVKLLDPSGIHISLRTEPPPPPPGPPPPPAPPPPPPPGSASTRSSTASTRSSTGAASPAAAPRRPSAPPPPPPPRARCLVPRVVGLKLGLAERKIRRAHCSVGAVRRKRATRARVGLVLAQKPRARAIRRRGFPVTLLVGKR